MDVSRKVLAMTSLYLEWRAAQSTADQLADRLQADGAYLSTPERQAYDHIKGMMDIANRPPVYPPDPPPIMAQSTPMPALTPKTLSALDAQHGHTQAD